MFTLAACLAVTMQLATSLGLGEHRAFFFKGRQSFCRCFWNACPNTTHPLPSPSWSYTPPPTNLVLLSKQLLANKQDTFMHLINLISRHATFAWRCTLKQLLYWGAREVREACCSWCRKTHIQTQHYIVDRTSIIMGLNLRLFILNVYQDWTSKLQVAHQGFC